MSAKEQSLSHLHPSDQKEGEQSSQNSNSNSDKKKPKAPLATVGQVFSFARTSTTHWQMFGAFAFAVVSGLTFPGK